MDRTRSLLLVLLLAAVASAQDEQRDEFRRGLKKVWTSARLRRWKRAKAQLLETLAAHPEKNYVYAERAHVLELARVCILRALAGTPDLKKLVKGKLRSYSHKTRRIKIEYTAANLGDFVKSANLLQHPASFAGSHTIRFEGDRYPKEYGIQLAVCASAESFYQIVFGLFEITDRGSRSMGAKVKAVIDGGEPAVVAESGSGSHAGNAFKLQVRVSRTDIVVRNGSKRFMRARKNRKVWGRVVLMAGAEACSKITLEGQTEGSWMNGLIDRHLQARLRELERTYDPRKHLPGWLFENPKKNRAAAVADWKTWPVPLTKKQQGFMARVVPMLRARRYDQALVLCGVEDVALHAYLEAIAREGMGDYEAALERSRVTLRAHPDFIRARTIEARMLRKLRKTEQATAAANTLLGKYPGDAELHAELALVLLRAGDLAARGVVDRALLRGLHSASLERVASILHKGFHGPAWPARYTFKSSHYVVVTNTSRKRASAVSKALEQAYRAYTRMLGKPPRTKRRFNVYLFSGREGYLHYAKDLYGHAHEKSAGMYDPLLKQLILWDRAPASSLLGTARHEGLHQFLDSLMESPPLWFNEGLAEYVAFGKSERGRWNPGAIAQTHLKYVRDLHHDNRFDLRAFLYGSRGAFMKEGVRNYARGWAFMHFLRHSEQGKKIFERSWKAFRSTPSPRKALEQAFKGVDFARLRAQFKSYASANLR